VNLFRRLVSLGLLLVSVLLLPGCWGQKEVGNMSIVIGLGIDRLDDNRVRVTAQIIDPAGMRTGGSSGVSAAAESYVNHTSEGRNIEEAMDAFYENPWRSLFFAHNTIVVFGRQYAEHGIKNAIDFFDRFKDFRRIQILVVASGQAADVLSAKTGIEKVNARGLRELVEHGAGTSKTVHSIQLNVTDQFLSPSNTPLLAAVETNNAGKIKLAGVAAFKGDRLATIVNPDDTKGLMWFLGRVRQTQMLLPCAHSQHGIAVRLLRSQTHFKITSRHGSVSSVLVKVRGDAEIRRLCTKEVASAANLRLWGKNADSFIQRQMQQSLRHFQDAHLDAVQYGTTIFRTNPQYWRSIADQWEDLFPKTQTTYDIQINIIRSGMISNSPFSNYNKKIIPPKLGREDIHS
jgi:spore germination protein KC